VFKRGGEGERRSSDEVALKEEEGLRPKLTGKKTVCASDLTKIHGKKREKGRNR